MCIFEPFALMITSVGKGNHTSATTWLVRTKTLQRNRYWPRVPNWLQWIMYCAVRIFPTLAIDVVHFFADRRGGVLGIGALPDSGFLRWVRFAAAPSGELRGGSFHAEAPTLVSPQEFA